MKYLVVVILVLAILVSGCVTQVSPYERATSSSLGGSPLMVTGTDVGPLFFLYGSEYGIIGIHDQRLYGKWYDAETGELVLVLNKDMTYELYFTPTLKVTGRYTWPHGQGALLETNNPRVVFGAKFESYDPRGSIVNIFSIVEEDVSYILMILRQDVSIGEIL